MQAVMNNNAEFEAESRMNFAGGRDYMMRSEKRGGTRPPAAGGSGKKPPKRRRRRRAGFFYKLFMMLLLLTLWPIGLLMLWQRKVRWGAGTKLLTSVVTLAASIILLGFLLTVDTGNAQYSAIQNSVNDFLDDTADSLVVAWEEVDTQAMMVGHGVKNLSESLWISVRDDIADGIDAGVALGKDVRATVEGWISGSGKDTAEPEASAAPDAETTPEASAAPTALPKATAPAIAEITVSAGESALPVYIPQATPEAGDTIEAGTLYRDGEIDTAEAPEALPEPVEAQVFTVKPAKDAIVYYNEGGKCYHMASACGSMPSAVEHTLGDTLGSSVHRCSTCRTPDKAILDETYIVWTDENKTAHLSNECAKFGSKWNIIPADDAIAEKLTACYECDADEYLAAIAMKKEIVIEAPAEKLPEEEIPAETAEAEAAPETTPEPEADAVMPAAEEADAEATETPTEEPTEAPTEEPTEAPTEEPTEEPTEAPTEAPTEEPTEAPTEAPTEVPTIAPTAEPTEAPTAEPTAEPAPTLKPAGLATVYHTKNGKWYHAIENCSGMMGASTYTMEESYEHYKTCNACSAPKPELIGQDCLWMDKNKLCHTSDECEAFEGRYTLVLIADALEKKYGACEKCMADFYLTVEEAAVPESTVSSDGTVYYENILVVEVGG